MNIAPARPGRRNVAIIASSMAGNGAGRVQVLAELAAQHGIVQIINPVFVKRANYIWTPLVDDKTNRISFDVDTMSDFISSTQRIVAQIQCEAAVVSKARFSSMFIGMLIRHKLACPVVLDNDDWELSFFPGMLPLAIRDVEKHPSSARDDMPFDSFWTRIAEPLIETFADRTAACISLQQKFGGVLLRHSRNQRSFRPDPAKRKIARKKFGVGENDVAVLFLGTPRPHKGLIHVAKAMMQIGDPRLKFVVIGSSSDKRFVAELEAYPNVITHPDQPWSDLHRNVQLADAVCLFQDPISSTASYQIPAKLSDALAMGIEVATTHTAALADIPEQIITRLRDFHELDTWLRNLLTTRPSPREQERRRSWFLQELSHGVNATRLELLFREAQTRAADWPAAWTELFILLNRRFGSNLPETAPSWAKAEVR